jgi:signal transduction histidine kinase
VLCLLRSDDEPADVVTDDPALAPAPGLADLGSLAATVREAGTPVRIDMTGDVTAVPPTATLTAYRIVQEALTNVVRHSPGAEAVVQVQVGPAGVRIRVTDTGRASWLGGTGDGVGQPGGDDGHGIVGMRERAAVFGGTLEADPLPGGGFQVRAFLPVPGIAAGRVA